MSSPFNVFITGGTGFVGTALVKRLALDNIKLTLSMLADDDAGKLPETVQKAVVDPLSETSDYSTVLQDQNIVIHLAARVHVLRETSTDPLKEFSKVNLHGTERLARQAAQAGVKRFVFMSTIGVHGNNSGDTSYTEADIARPHNSYSLSKHKAELALQSISKETGMEVVIVRAPLAYGPCNPGNIFSLLRIVSKRIPLPLATISNKRSLIYVGNLVDALTICAWHPAAAGNIYLISDGEDISTPDLIRRTSSALGVSALLFPFPISLMKFFGKLTGKGGVVNRLNGSLTVDSSKIRRELGWLPPFTMDEGLRETAKWFKSRAMPHDPFSEPPFE
ncbi:NAD-dependent epimerase/dehydratase family protein [Candidatus Roizmanbacteria bacterium]|nr:NAD-dependent epimerase/dehydratase family protein [Candidatus Roizmanbacteria bacterium]